MIYNESQDPYYSMCIFYVVYRKDWPNLYMSLRSLVKNWVGPKRVAFIAQDNNYDFINSFARFVLKGWTIHQVPITELSIIDYGDRHNCRGVGWDEQQLYKLYLPSQLAGRYQWFLNLDCKNILIKPAAPSSFMRFDTSCNQTVITIAGRYLTEQAREEMNNDPWTKEIHQLGKELTGGSDITVVPYTLCPWIFNGLITSTLWQRLGAWRWTEMKSTEYILYWYTVNHLYLWDITLQCIGTWAEDPYHKGNELNNITDRTLIYNSHINQFHTHGKDIVTWLVRQEILEYNDIQPIFDLVVN